MRSLCVFVFVIKESCQPFHYVLFDESHSTWKREKNHRSLIFFSKLVNKVMLSLTDISSANNTMIFWPGICHCSTRTPLQGQFSVNYSTSQKGSFIYETGSAPSSSVWCRELIGKVFLRASINTLTRSILLENVMPSFCKWYSSNDRYVWLFRQVGIKRWCSGSLLLTWVNFNPIMDTCK